MADPAESSWSLLRGGVDTRKFSPWCPCTLNDNPRLKFKTAHYPNLGDVLIRQGRGTIGVGSWFRSEESQPSIHHQVPSAVRIPRLGLGIGYPCFDHPKPVKYPHTPLADAAVWTEPVSSVSQVRGNTDWRCQLCGVLSNLEVHHKEFGSQSGIILSRTSSRRAANAT